jgi:low affinity Fe/Cu permease
MYAPCHKICPLFAFEIAKKADIFVAWSILIYNVENWLVKFIDNWQCNNVTAITVTLVFRKPETYMAT